jgi:hypothetical protein
MFYASENLVHVCLNESHGPLCFFEPDNCWFAVRIETAKQLAENKKVKFHLIPESILENAGLGKDFACEYSDDSKKESN